MIDTHCHLTFPDLRADVPGVLARAAEHGVRGAITISTTTRDAPQALAIAEQYDNVWCSAGVHPLHADEGPHDWEVLRRVAQSPRCVAWGELGLDNHYDEPARAVQHQVLHEQLEFIRRCREAEGAGRIELPVILHCRKAFGDLIPVLRDSGLDPARFVFHCFTGGPGDMRMLLDFGSMVSFTGVLTYRNAAEVREAAKLAPADRIMVETDAPFLSPEPKRGVRPCEPWMTSLTAKRLAEVRGERWAALRESLEDNTRRFFGVG